MYFTCDTGFMFVKNFFLFSKFFVSLILEKLSFNIKMIFQFPVSGLYFKATNIKAFKSFVYLLSLLAREGFLALEYYK